MINLIYTCILVFKSRASVLFSKPLCTCTMVCLHHTFSLTVDNTCISHFNTKEQENIIFSKKYVGH